MREILFRGKRVDNGEWVEGSIVVSQDRINYGKCYMTSSVCDFSYGDNGDRIRLGCFVEVIPETVGQFTGLYDKNGKRIFDMDILSFETMRGTISFTVYYDEECGVWQPFGDSYCGFDPKDVEVIGNIHDNPELL